jgi:diguanylate cyclase (GGDEF)-like protein
MYSDFKERKLIIKIFAIIACLTTGFMSGVASFNSNYLLAGVLALTSLSFFIAFYVVQFLHRSLYISSSIILYTVFVLMLYLVLSGGNHGSGILWIYLVPQVTFFIRGLKRGIKDLVLFGIAMIITFYAVYYFQMPSYYLNTGMLQFASRVCFSFLIVAVLSGIYEYFREKYNNKIITLAKNNKRLSITDPLTQLSNRRFALEEIDKLKNINKEGVFSIVLVDVDDFKRINDEFGHLVGDKVLIYLAEIFTDELSNNSSASRWGGEEFLFLLPNTNKNQAIQMMKMLQASLSQTPFKANKEILNITVSMGIREVNGSKSSIDEDIKYADDLLYVAKESGKNKACA